MNWLSTQEHHDDSELQILQGNDELIDAQPVTAGGACAQVVSLSAPSQI